jgi:HNH endonuclease
MTNESTPALLPLYDKETVRRFEAKFRANEKGCWVWGAGGSGHIDKDGYGQFKLSGHVERAHRASWLIYRGPIDPGHDIDHRCDKVEGGPERPNRACVNPDHLEVVLHAENLRRREIEDASELKFSPKAVTPINPDLILAWAEEMVDEAQFVYTKTQYDVASTTEAQWREYADTFEEGLTGPAAAWALVALYLYIVQLGVDWQHGAVRLLRLSPLSLRNWARNADWRQDFANARMMARDHRWRDIESTFIDNMERRASSGSLKDLTRGLMAIDKHFEHKDAPRLARGGAPPQLNGPAVHIHITEGPHVERLMSGVVDALFRVVPTEEMPPPAHWETTDDEVEADDE